MQIKDYLASGQQEKLQKALKEEENSSTATLLISCPKHLAFEEKIVNFIYSNGGNIIHADRHTDFATGSFFMRIEWQLKKFYFPRDVIESAWGEIAKPLEARWKIHFSDTIPRIAIWVTKQSHCLLDLLWRWRVKELQIEIPVIISNHADLETISKQFDINFYHIPVNPENKLKQEIKQLELLDKYHIDLVILANYMQILSPYFIKQFPRIINIHHSFLPAFAGAKSCQRAHERGVKIIGTTAHYVTEDLAQGPIIEQDIVRVSHRDEVVDLIRKSKDLERLVLARAVRLHIQNRLLIHDNQTVVFG